MYVYAEMYACGYAFMHACIYGCMYALHACGHVCMYMRIFVYPDIEPDYLDLSSKPDRSVIEMLKQGSSLDHRNEIACMRTYESRATQCGLKFLELDPVKAERKIY
jgi:hypothetical protein